MTRQKYKTYLRSAHWRDTRLQALQDGGHKCWACESTRKLHVHHKTYERVGCEVPADLVVLCDTCHTLAHRLVKSEQVKLADAHTAVKRDFEGQPIISNAELRRQARADKTKAATATPKPVSKAEAKKRKNVGKLDREYRKPRMRRLEDKYEQRRKERAAAREARDVAA